MPEKPEEPSEPEEEKVEEVEELETMIDMEEEAKPEEEELVEAPLVSIDDAGDLLVRYKFLCITIRCDLLSSIHMLFSSVLCCRV